MSGAAKDVTADEVAVVSLQVVEPHAVAGRMQIATPEACCPTPLHHAFDENDDVARVPTPADAFIANVGRDTLRYFVVLAQRLVPGGRRVASRSSSPISRDGRLRICRKASWAEFNVSSFRCQPWKRAGTITSA